MCINGWFILICGIDGRNRRISTPSPRAMVLVLLYSVVSGEEGAGVCGVCGVSLAGGCEDAGEEVWVVWAVGEGKLLSAMRHQGVIFVNVNTRVYYQKMSILVYISICGGTRQCRRI
jgi:hypothetical protein